MHKTGANIPYITFAVCTYNRASIIVECLNSILLEVGVNYNAEILVVDNNSTDNTLEVVQSISSKEINLRIIKEKKQGLSYARNRAAEEALGEWVVYIDDDAKLRPGYFEELEKVIELNQFDCFGGTYYAWFPFGTKKWLPENFGTKRWIRKDTGLIDRNGDLLSGGNLAVKKSILLSSGGFDGALGMKGQKVGYGEEDAFQIKLMDAGYKIGFVPDLIIDHAVMPHKLSLSWHLQSAKIQGKVNEQLLIKKSGFLKKFLAFNMSLIGLFIKRLPHSTWKLITTKEYYWQNMYLDLFRPLYKTYGAFLSSEE